MTAIQRPFRVRCVESGWTRTFSTLDQARRWLALLASVARTCEGPHRIEACHGPADVGWVRLPSYVLTLNEGTRHDGMIVARQSEYTFDGSLICYALLTGDGQRVLSGSWCQCAPMPHISTLVRFERWEITGLKAEGDVCPTCRKLTSIRTHR